MPIGGKLSLDDSASFSNPTLDRSTVGALQYLTMTRPDLSFVVNMLSQYLNAPTQACKRVLRYMKGTGNYVLYFKPATNLVLEGLTDAVLVASMTGDLQVDIAFILEAILSSVALRNTRWLLDCIQNQNIGP